MTFRTPVHSSILVRCALLCAACDLPAGTKVCGLLTILPILAAVAVVKISVQGCLESRITEALIEINGHTDQ